MPMFDTLTPSSPVDLDFENQEQGHEDVVQAEPEQQQELVEQQEEVPNETDSPQDDAPPAEDTGELILGKYRSTAELIKAHENLQKRLGEMGRELGDLRKQTPMEQAQQALQQKAQDEGWTDEQWTQYNERFWDEFNRSPGKAVAQLAADIAQQIVKQEVSPIAQQFEVQRAEKTRTTALQNEFALFETAFDEAGRPLYPDADKLRPAMESKLKENPMLADIVVQQAQARAKGADIGYDILEMLYKSAKADTLTNLRNQAYSNGLQQGVKQAQNKTVGALPKANAKTQTSEPSPEDEIVNGIFTHRKGALF